MTRRLVACTAAAALCLGGLGVAYGTSGAAEVGPADADELRAQLHRERAASAALVRGLRYQLRQANWLVRLVNRPSPAGNRRLARRYFGGEFSCAARIIQGETGGTWRHDVAYGFRYGEHLIRSGLAYGLPQSKPGTKMLSAGRDAASNPLTQLVWMRSYAVQRYGSVCGAAAHWTPRRSW